MKNDNKIIAEFMGFTKDSKDLYLIDDYNLRGEDEYQATYISEMKFNTSWSWLMPVIEKIESIGFSCDRIDGDVFINDKNGNNVIPNPMDVNTMTMLQKTYYVVIEFINQYNK